VNANSRPSFIVQTLSFMNCSCNFICGLSDVIIKTFSQSVSQKIAPREVRAHCDNLLKTDFGLSVVEVRACYCCSGKINLPERLIEGRKSRSKAKLGGGFLGGGLQ